MFVCVCVRVCVCVCGLGIQTHTHTHTNTHSLMFATHWREAGCYSHSQGVRSIRERVAAFILQRDGYPAVIPEPQPNPPP
jgi:aspartate/methionine/tyrosine aminotransferase